MADDTTISGYLRRTACPCCNASLGESKRGVQSSPRAEDISFDQHGRFISGFGPNRIFFTYARCGRCDAFYCPVYYGAEQLRRLYESQPENMADVPIGSRERTQAGYVDILRRHSMMAGGFLEIGADIGLFAEACVRAGQFERLWLTEPNKDAHGQLEGRFAGRDTTILGSMASTTEVPSGAVSTAVMIHVLDHLPEPTAMLAEIFRALEPGGVLMIVTHNVRSWLASLTGKRFPPFALQHPQLFSPQALRSLATSSGFEVVEIVRTINYFPATLLMRAGLTVLGLPANWLPDRQGFDVGVRLGNICTIARRPHR